MNDSTAPPPSERACDRCRERRVKVRLVLITYWKHISSHNAQCDKRQPTCQRCEKLGKPCPGYDKKRKFVDEGVSLRKKYQASTDQGESGEPASDAVRESRVMPFRGRSTDSVKTSDHDAPSANTPGFSGNGFTPTNIPHDQWNQHQSEKSISVPEDAPARKPRLGGVGEIVASNPTLTGPVEAQNQSQVPSLDPVNEQPVLFPETNFASRNLQGDAMLDDFWDGGNYDPAWFNIEPELYYGNNNNSCGFIPNAHIIDEVDRGDLRPTIEPTESTPMSVVGSTAHR